MDNNKKNSSNFWKKEGFYLILFICLCIVATVAVVTSKNFRKQKIKPPVVQQNKEKDTGKVAVKDTTTPEVINNAQLVDRNSKANTASNNSNNKTAAVAKNTVLTFMKPVEGSLMLDYSEKPVMIDKDGKQWATHGGIDIKCGAGKNVVSAFDGIVKRAEKTNDGYTIGIYSQEGSITAVYGNLDSKINVKVGQKVKKGDSIGKVGNTATNLVHNNCKDCLHFEVWQGKRAINPSKYVNYSKAK